MSKPIGITKAAEKYKQGKVTISHAACIAEVTVWEMEEYLVQQGYKSSYSVEDFEEELSALKNMKKSTHKQEGGL